MCTVGTTRNPVPFSTRRIMCCGQGMVTVKPGFHIVVLIAYSVAEGSLNECLGRQSRTRLNFADYLRPCLRQSGMYNMYVCAISPESALL